VSLLHRAAGTRLGILSVALGLLLTSPTNASAAPSEDSLRVSRADAATNDVTSLLAYWTPERMANAVPAEARSLRDNTQTTPMSRLFSPLTSFRSTVLPSVPRQKAAGPHGGGYLWRGGGHVTKTTGKVFFTVEGTDFVCSATVVTSANRDTLVTAGHCVNAGPGEFATRWIFVPGYQNGKRPYGTWTARGLFASPAWQTRGDIDQDVGFAVLHPNSTGQHIADVVGTQTISFTQPRGAYTYTFGYPALAEYDGESLYYCRDNLVPDTQGTHDQGMRCTMTEGASGGPWLSNFNPATGVGTVTSVSSFGYDDKPGVMWGPTFTEPIRALYGKAQTS
jgi:V8-like Glu-specific endopeptidase